MSRWATVANGGKLELANFFGVGRVDGMDATSPEASALSISPVRFLKLHDNNGSC